MRTLSPLVAIALLAACSGPERSLAKFSDCDEMQGYMQRMASRELRDGWGGGGGALGRDFITTSDMSFAAEENGGTAVPSDPSFSGTNLQESGVDEADLIKTDGEYLYAIAGGHLVVTRAWPIASAAVLGQVAFDGHPQGLFLLDDGDTAVVISDLAYGQQPQPLSGAADDPSVSWRPYEPAAVISVIDLTDRANPKVVRETYTTGEVKATRRIGNKLFLVSYEDIAVGYEGNDREQRAAVYGAVPVDWQVERFDNVLTARGLEGAPDTWEFAVTPGCDCDETFYSEELGGTYVANALVLDLNDPTGEFEGIAVAGRADTVYMGADSLYLAYTEPNSGPFASFDNITETVIHKFDVTGDTPTYAATGVVRGTLTDSFSLSDKDGILRLGVTDFGTSGQGDDVSSGVYTFEQDGTDLAPLDWVIGLAPGESITAARFVGDFGYVSTAEFVTFSDPLFTFDLSDPADIVQGGALEVDGWSDYLHPVDEGHLLSVGWDDGLAVSLYDVSDLQNPTMTQRQTLAAWSSEAQTDHHAFNYFAPTATLTIPSWANEGDTVLEVLHADANGIDPIGRVHQDDALLPTQDTWCGGIRRSVIIEDTVWAVSSAGMTAAKLDAPGTPIGELSFDAIDPCYDGYDYSGGGDEVMAPDDRG